MQKRRVKIEFRYYEMPEKELVLALLGDEWIRPYGEGIDYLHFHNFMEIGICHQGHGEIILDETHCEFGAGRIVLIPPNLPHTTNCTEGTTAFWEWLYLDMDTVLEEMYPYDVTERRKVRNHIYERPFFLRNKEQLFLHEIILHIVREMKERKYLYRDTVRSLLRLLITEILRMHDAEEQMNRRHQNTMIIKPAMEYVENFYPEPIRIADLAAACNISESHFRRVFQDTMNMKPLDYVNLIRIQKACLMMKKANGSMEDIAYRSGFENVSTFNRNFKRILNTSPYQWKKSADNYEGKLVNYRISAQKGW
ncbi:MAG: helix-turn-helix domain-containing protein [Lachnospiraceae bacterium]